MIARVHGAKLQRAPRSRRGGARAPTSPPPERSSPEDRTRLTFAASVFLLLGVIVCGVSGYYVTGYYLTLSTGVFGKPGTCTVEHTSSTSTDSKEGTRGTRHEGTFRSHDGIVRDDDGLPGHVRLPHAPRPGPA
ncbi:hypothetical protein ACFQVC_27240 [Streptomyces monticola]|uniref:Uncharacterized protein n=1 Tax=Streptomyces monticola TaxID=2666263 RepID=A0ABW2JPT7_9ACTN